jgi:hypothetical protein
MRPAGASSMRLMLPLSLLPLEWGVRRGMREGLRLHGGHVEVAARADVCVV